MTETIKALIVEDSPGDAQVMLRHLERHGLAVDYRRVETPDAMKEALGRGSWDLVLCDHSLPGFDSHSALMLVKERAPDLPFVLVSGVIGEDAASAAVRAGACDYVPKSDLWRLGQVVERELRGAEERWEWRRARTRLQESEARYRALFENAQSGFVLGRIAEGADGDDPDVLCLQSNDVFLRMMHKEPGPEGRRLADMLLGEDGENDGVLQALARAAATGERQRVEYYSEGLERWWSVSAYRPGEGLVAAWFDDVTEQKQAEAACAEKVRLNQMLLDALPCEALLLEPETRTIVAMNRAALEAGARLGDTCFRSWAQADAPCPGCPAAKVWATGESQHQELEAAGVVWDIHWVRIGEDLYLRYAFDVTEQRALQRRIEQGARLEAIGRLAGGVAHDFNNLLTGIQGYVGFALAEVAQESQIHQDLTELRGLTDRATDLVQQMLAFSHQDAFETTPVEVNAVVNDVARLLERIMGEDVELKLNLGDLSRRVVADRGRLEQVVLNLALNARGAMPEGGVLTITTSEVATDRGPGSSGPARRIMIAVSDTGVGMDEETRKRVSEPFFTTKAAAGGTGLGLSVAHGIVEQHGGSVEVASAPGVGTTFTVALPAADPAPDCSAAREQGESALGGGETVLLAEDEAVVREVMCRMLEGLGYEVFAADGPDSAESLFVEHRDQIDLLVTDVLMPGRTGQELSDRLSAYSPALKTLYVSGYVDSNLLPREILDSGTAFIQKPFSIEELGCAIRGALDDGSSADH